MVDTASQMRVELWEEEYRGLLEQLLEDLTENEALLLWQFLEIGRIAPPWD